MSESSIHHGRSESNDSNRVTPERAPQEMAEFVSREWLQEIADGPICAEKGYAIIVLNVLEAAEGRLAELEQKFQGAEKAAEILLSEATDMLRERDAEVKNLTEALRFYANGENYAGWNYSDMGNAQRESQVERDRGRKAREALRAERASTDASSEQSSEPAKDDPNEGLSEEFTQAQEWGFDHPPLRGQA